MRFGFFVFFLFAVLLAVVLWHARSTASSGAAESARSAHPLLLEQNEGERRMRRHRQGPMASEPFIIKVDARNGGSNDLVFLTEKFGPGRLIPLHRHLHQDEIVFIENGAVHARVGNQERDLHAGATIYIPRNTWVTIKNIGDTPISLLAIFDGSGFERYLRCSSVPAGAKVTWITNEQRRACAKDGQVVYQGL